MGCYSTRWLRFALLAVSTACGSGSESAPASGTGGVTGASGSAGVAGNSSGSGGTVTPTALAGAGGVSGSVGGSAGGVGGSTGGVAQGGSLESGGAGAGAGGVSPDPCPEAPAPRLASGTVVELPLELTLDGAPLQFAEANPLPAGATLTPLSVRFYISDVALLRDGGEPLPVDVVTSAGAVAPYGVHLFNADDDASTTLRVLAPAGEYQGITFVWGLALSCNRRHPAASNPPLSATSQMSWPHGGGYLFFRYEGRTALAGQGGAGAGAGGAAGAGPVTAGGATAAGGSSSERAAAGGTATGAGTGGGAGSPSSTYPSVIHMGGNVIEELAPLIRVEGALSVPADGPVQKRVRIAMEDVFEGALADVDLTGYTGAPGEEMLKGERLRRSLSSLTVFSFDP
jgi:hypothetical protein